MPSKTSEDPSPLKAGEFVLLDYEMWADGGEKPELVDTTREEVAQKANITIGEGKSIQPRAHLVGGDYFPTGVESALVGAKIGVEIEKEFPPAEAFGERDPKLIELFSMHEISRLPEMRREDADLSVGTILTIRGRRGRVSTLTAARVRVDFNPAYSGRRIRLKALPMNRISEPHEQARALIELAYGRGKEFDVKFHQGLLTLKVPERAKFDFAWLAAKPRVVDRLRSHLKPKSVHIVEEYDTPEPESERPAAKSADGSKDGAKDKGTPAEASPAKP